MSPEIPLVVRFKEAFWNRYVADSTEQWSEQEVYEEIANALLPTMSNPELYLPIFQELYGAELNATEDQIHSALNILLVECRRNLDPQIWESHKWQKYNERLDVIEALL